MNEFTCVLVSNSNKANTSSNFRTILPETLSFGDGRWGVGVADVVFCKSWNSPLLDNSFYTIYYKMDPYGRSPLKILIHRTLRRLSNR